MFQPNKNVFFNIVIILLPFFLTSYSLHTQVHANFDFDGQYLQNVLFTLIKRFEWSKSLLIRFPIKKSLQERFSILPTKGD